MSDDQALPVNPSDDDATLPVDHVVASGIGSDAQIGTTIGPCHLVASP